MQSACGGGVRGWTECGRAALVSWMLVACSHLHAACRKATSSVNAAASCDASKKVHSCSRRLNTKPERIILKKKRSVRIVGRSVCPSLETNPLSHTDSFACDNTALMQTAAMTQLRRTSRYKSSTHLLFSSSYTILTLPTAVRTSFFTRYQLFTSQTPPHLIMASQQLLKTQLDDS